MPYSSRKQRLKVRTLENPQSYAISVTVTLCGPRSSEQARFRRYFLMKFPKLMPKLFEKKPDSVRSPIPVNLDSASSENEGSRQCSMTSGSISPESEKSAR